jgi:hypothetical protein
LDLGVERKKKEQKKKKQKKEGVEENRAQKQNRLYINPREVRPLVRARVELSSVSQRIAVNLLDARTSEVFYVTFRAPTRCIFMKLNEIFCSCM